MQNDVMNPSLNSLKSGELRKVPVLSLGAYKEGSVAEQNLFVEKLFSGIKDYGFIVLKDHGIPADLFSQAYQLLQLLFDLPLETKMKYVSASGGGQRGYTPFGKEHAKDHPVMDLKEFWHVGRQVESNHPFAKYYPENIWPDQEVPEFKQVFSTLFHSLELAGIQMMEALAAPLEVEKHFFTEMVQEGNSILRLLHYPPIPQGADPRCLRAAPHEDINFITILPAATTSGLQLKDRDGQWLDVVSEPGTLIVDAGDMLARITNDVIPSTTHQVVNPADGKNQRRFSMPFFMHPHPESILSCLASCKKGSGKYPDISAHEFLMQRLREIGLIK